MKTPLIKTLVMTLSFAAIGLLALSPSKAADAAAPAADPMGGCCGAQPPAEAPPTPTTCGAGTIADTATGTCLAPKKKK